MIQSSNISRLAEAKKFLEHNNTKFKTRPPPQTPPPQQVPTIPLFPSFHGRCQYLLNLKCQGPDF